MKEKTYACSKCGEKIIRSEAHEFDGQILCSDCLEELTILCDCCLRRIWRDDDYGNSSITLCSNCRENYYTTCDDCGVLIHNDDACYDEDSDYNYCRTCYDRLNDYSIRSYSYKPDPVFFGSGNLFMGVELEIDKGGESDKNAEEILHLANRSGRKVYCKHDGSLYEGFEIVSHPMTLDYHKNEMNWKEVFDKALELGYYSHNTESCGLHVHCNRDSFGETPEDRDAAIGRVVFFVEKHWYELVKFSRRKEANLDRWAARYATISTSTKETYNKAKSKGMGRYVAVNLLNWDTIEFRIFRGTLKYKTFIATLQLVSQICTLAASKSDEDFERMSWLDFVQTINDDDMPELIEYLKSKRLYVNELIDESEEV